MKLENLNLVKKDGGKVSAWDVAAKRNIQDFYRFQLLSATILKSDSVFLDIGANIGEYSRVALKYISPRNVHMFEPIPRIADYLRETFSECNIYEVVCSDSNGNVNFFESNNHELSGLIKRSESTLPRGTTFEKINVNSVKLDDFLENVESVTLVKIDVEGSEILVLNGMKQIIKRHQPIIFVEHGVNGPEYFGNSSLDLWNLCQDLDYQIFTVDGEFIDDLSVLRDSFTNWPIWNYVLVPQSED